MKIKKYTLLEICAVVAAVIGFVVLYYQAYQEADTNIDKATKKAFEQTVNDDLNDRLFGIKHFRFPLGRKVKDVQIATKDGVETVQLDDSLDEKVVSQMMQQFVLAELHPLNPDTFNLLFQKELVRNEVVPAKTGVIYQYKGQKHYSGNDSAIAQSAIVLPPETLDIKKFAIVQAWVKVAPISVLKNLSRKTWQHIALYAVCCIGVAVCFLVRRVRAKRAREKEQREAERQRELQQLEALRQQELQRLQAEKEQELQQLKEMKVEQEELLLRNAVKLGDMILYEKNRTVYARGESHILSKYQFELLMLFAKAPEHILTVDDIKEKFWPKNSVYRNNMYNLIFKTKETIKPFSDCEIKSEGEEIYRLVCPSTGVN